VVINVNDVTIRFRTDFPPASTASSGDSAPETKDTIMVNPTGIPYYDALLLDSLSHTQNIASMITILAYYKKQDLVRNKSFILDAFYGNGYIKEHLEKHWDSMNAVAARTTNVQSSNFFTGIPGAVSAVGGINVTNIADGLARFLVERMKSELSASFFDRFEKTLNDPKYEDLKVLFPETWKMLASMDDDIYQYSSYLNTMRQAFAKDMANEYANLGRLLNQPKYKDYLLRQRPELGSVLYSSLYVIDGISSGKHPGDVLKDYSTENYIHLKDSVAQLDVRSAIQTAQLISASIRSLSSVHYWVPADSIRRMVENETTFKLYLGLVYEQSGHISLVLKNSDTVTFRQVLRDLYTSIERVDQLRDSLNEFRNFIEVFADNAHAVNDYITIIKEQKKSETDYNDYYRLFNAFLDLVQHSVTFTRLPYVNLGPGVEQQIAAVSGKWIYVARSSGDLYVDVKTKNYISALQNTLGILDTLLNYNTIEAMEVLVQKYDSVLRVLVSSTDFGKLNQKRIGKRLEDIDFDKLGNKRITWEMIEEQLPKMIAREIDTQQEKDLLISMAEQKFGLYLAKNRNRLREYTVKYGAFIAAVAEAQTSDEVEEAIEAAVLPPGSARIKRETDFNIALNGYVGFFAGYEHIDKIDHDGIREVNFQVNKWNSYGVTAPIGISFNLGKKSAIPLAGIFMKGNSSHSIFLSVVDIGALASFRLSSSNDSISQVPDVQLKDIVSPGVFYSIGFARCPISVNLGYQVGPLLREVGPQANVYGQGYSRFSVSVCVDIPMFNLYTSTR